MPGFVTLLIDLALSLPGAVVAGIGLVLSMTNRRRLGSSAGPMLVAFILLLVAAVVSAGQMVFSVFSPDMMVRNHWSYSTLSMILGGIGAVHTLIATAGWVVLLIAIFRRRDTATTPATPTWNQPPAAQFDASASLPAPQPGVTTPQFGAGQQPGVTTPQFGAGQQPGVTTPRYGTAEAPGAPAGEQQPGGWTTPGSGPSPY
ncbi:hypothetical protein Athai_64040 [Actinocatenispora thailandica]|uniref:Uncharacterized protein n=1 Tax=Actinocatenispora thailandica TaxID=227318 RepID=A0A7R7I0S2_9ACTN|nr:hypothetical protein [Actinocatenispora thailandica]BCJ38901.1 hypothetical protein Athai_64040 [Actinocatenispora thailandica]